MGINMNAWRITLLPLLLVLLIFESVSANQVSYGPETSQPPIRFLGDKDYPPVEWLENNKPRGIFASFLEELAITTNRQITYKLLDWQQAQKDVLSNRGDVLTVFSPNDERINQYDFIDGFLNFEISLFVRSDNLTIHGLEDLKGIKTGVTKGGFPRQVVESQSQAKLVTIANHRDGFRELQNGDIDALATTKWVGAYTIQKYKIANIKIVPKPIAIKSTHMGVRKGDSETIAILKAGIEKMQKNGTLEHLNQQWSGYNMVYLTESTVKRTLFYSAITLTALLILLGASVIWVLRKKVKQKTKSLSEANEKLERSLDTLLKTQNQLIQTEKVAALSTAVAGVAHEINTPIGIAITTSSTALDNLKQLSDTAQKGQLSQQGLDTFISSSIEALELEAESLRRAASLIQDFKRIATQQKMEHREVFSLSSIIKQAIDTVSEQFSSITIELKQSETESMHMDSYPMPLYQVLVELMENACRHAFSDKQTEKRIYITPGIFEERIIIKVEDNGEGIAEKQISKIFDPFYTAHHNTKSSGLGLSITHTLVNNVLGGKIKVTRNQNEGLSFYIELPSTAPELDG